MPRHHIPRYKTRLLSRKYDCSKELWVITGGWQNIYIMLLLGLSDGVILLVIYLHYSTTLKI